MSGAAPGKPGLYYASADAPDYADVNAPDYADADAPDYADANAPDYADANVGENQYSTAPDNTAYAAPEDFAANSPAPGSQRQAAPSVYYASADIQAEQASNMTYMAMGAAADDAEYEPLGKCEPSYASGPSIEDSYATAQSAGPNDNYSTAQDVAATTGRAPPVRRATTELDMMHNTTTTSPGGRAQAGGEMTYMAMGSTPPPRDRADSRGAAFF